ncbi:MAG: response regulator [Methanomassiliicoccales archaeon]
MTSERRSAHSILLLEDNPADVMFLEEVLKSSKYQVTLHVVSNGKDALDFLKRAGKFATASEPDLIMMDMSLPRLQGETVLQKIKGDPELRMTPIIVFTGSDAPADVIEAYRAYANSYIVKPVGLDKLTRRMETLFEYWFGVAELPIGCRSGR